MTKPEKYDYQFHRNDAPSQYAIRVASLTSGQLLYADYLCRTFTGYSTLEEMCKNYPTLRSDIQPTDRLKKAFQHLREFYAIGTGRPAFGCGDISLSEIKN